MSDRFIGSPSGISITPAASDVTPEGFVTLPLTNGGEVTVHAWHIREIVSVGSVSFALNGLTTDQAGRPLQTPAHTRVSAIIAGTLREYQVQLQASDVRQRLARARAQLDVQTP